MRTEQPKVPLATKLWVTALLIAVAHYPIAIIHPDLLAPWLSRQLFGGIALFLVVAVFLVFLRWVLLERQQKVDSPKMLELFHTLIAYFITLGFTKWALLKFLCLHMTTSLSWMEMPDTMLSGYQLVSHFYGQNYPMVMALGIIELMGAIFIAFRRTRLLGAFILVTACANILLIDLLYQIYRPITEATILLVANGYLIYLEREKVKQLLLGFREKAPRYTTSKGLQSLLWLTAFLIPVLVFVPNYKKQYKPTITGKYAIIQFVQADPLYEKYEVVYFDLGDYFALTSADFKQRLVGELEMDEPQRTFTVKWLNEDTPDLVGHISPRTKDGRMTLTGTLGEQPFELKLQKQTIHSLRQDY